MTLSHIWIYLSSVLVFLVVDGIWLKVMTSRFYAPRVGHLLSESPNMLAAAGFYLFYIFALCILVIYPQVKMGAPLWQLFVLSGLIGFMAYGTYNFTALALLKDYSTSAALVDFVWGGFVTGVIGLVVGWLSYHVGWLS